MDGSVWPVNVSVNVPVGAVSGAVNVAVGATFVTVTVAVAVAVAPDGSVARTVTVRVAGPSSQVKLGDCPVVSNVPLSSRSQA